MQPDAAGAGSHSDMSAWICFEFLSNALLIPAAPLMP
jgi:hypothetical protein